MQTPDDLRDYFAGQALAGLLAQTTFTESGYPTPVYEVGVAMPPSMLARHAYGIADAMLAERIKTRDQ